MPSFIVAKNHTSSVKVFDGATGAYLEDFIEVGSGGLRNPGLMTFTETDPVTLAYTGATNPTSAAAPVSRPAYAMTHRVFGEAAIASEGITDWLDKLKEDPE